MPPRVVPLADGGYLYPPARLLCGELQQRNSQADVSRRPCREERVDNSPDRLGVHAAAVVGYLYRQRIRRLGQAYVNVLCTRLDGILSDIKDIQ